MTLRTEARLRESLRLARGGDREAFLVYVSELARTDQLPAPGCKNPLVTVTLELEATAPPRPVRCPECKGTAYTVLPMPQECEACNASGFVWPPPRLRSHPWRVQKVGKMGSWWTPCLAVNQWRGAWPKPCGHCGGTGRLGSCMCVACTSARAYTNARDCAQCGGDGQTRATPKMRKLGTPGQPYLCPTTDRGQCYWHEDYALPFDGAQELLDYLRERVVAWRLCAAATRGSVTG